MTDRPGKTTQEIANIAAKAAREAVGERPPPVEAKRREWLRDFPWERVVLGVLAAGGITYGGAQQVAHSDSVPAARVEAKVERQVDAERELIRRLYQDRIATLESQNARLAADLEEARRVKARAWEMVAELRQRIDADTSFYSGEAMEAQPAEETR